MTLPPDYLDYPLRRRGMDHDLYRFRALPQAKPVTWPGGARVALWVAVHMGHFPMDLPMKPFTVLGAGERAYPSYWDYTQRDYGNRIGVYRILKALSDRGLRATALMSGVLPERYPPLARDIADAGWEVAAGGLDMGHVHHGGVPEAEERQWIGRALSILRGAFGAEAIRGWHSPGFSESLRTLDLLGEAGLDWVADWGVNDDMPYALATASGRALTSMPLSYDLSDQRMIYQHNLATEDFTTAILAAHAALDAEAAATGAGRILCLAVTPWVMGQPHRIRALGALLDALAARGGLWPATGAEILDAWRAQTGNED